MFRKTASEFMCHVSSYFCKLWARDQVFVHYFGTQSKRQCDGCLDRVVTQRNTIWATAVRPPSSHSFAEWGSFHGTPEHIRVNRFSCRRHMTVRLFVNWGVKVSSHGNSAEANNRGRDDASVCGCVWVYWLKGNIWKHLDRMAIPESTSSTSSGYVNHDIWIPIVLDLGNIGG